MSAGKEADLLSNGPIEISGSINFEFGVTVGNPLLADGAADLKSNAIIEFSGPYNPKIDTRP